MAEELAELAENDIEHLIKEFPLTKTDDRDLYYFNNPLYDWTDKDHPDCLLLDIQLFKVLNINDFVLFSSYQHFHFQNESTELYQNYFSCCQANDFGAMIPCQYVHRIERILRREFRKFLIHKNSKYNNKDEKTLLPVLIKLTDKWYFYIFQALTA